MLRAIRAEFIKAFSLTSTYVYILCISGAIAVNTVLHQLFDANPRGDEWTTLTGLGVLPLIIAIFFGASSMGNDQSQRYTAHAFLTLQYRWQLPVAKGIMLTCITFVATLIGYAIAAATQLVAGNNLPLPDHQAQLWLFFFSASMFALAGQGFTAVLHSKVALLAIAMAWMFIIEGLFAWGPFEWGPKVAYYLPVVNWTFAVCGSQAPFDASLTHSTVIVVAWALVAILGGIGCIQRRNVK